MSLRDNSLHAWTFEIAGATVSCEDAPWAGFKPLLDSRDKRKKLPDYIDGRMHIPPGTWGSGEFSDRRTMLWGTVVVASRGDVSEDALFRSSGQGRCFTLKGPAPSRVPLQRLHIGPSAIPDELADQRCADFKDVEELLHLLNDILGTVYTLAVPGLESCLLAALQSFHNLGEVYGHMRPYWFHDFAQVSDLRARRAAEDTELRQSAVRDGCIVNPETPPRRVWDLFSNRVLPFHALVRANSDSHSVVPMDIWTVSHSWVDDRDQEVVWTSINGREWPAPIPRATTLTHIRLELLNLGAEYVWLDVLCLRQRGREEDEDRRREEWQLDVPIIGYIYRHSFFQTCVTYFNGLGIPLEVDMKALGSSRHWYSRMWTLQEACIGWLPGGLTDKPAPAGAGSHLFGRLEQVMDDVMWDNSIFRIVDVIKARHCSNDVDRISGLAYLLCCATTPIYDEDMTVEAAWALLVKHLPRRVLTWLLFVFPSATVGRGLMSWQPSWEQMNKCSRSLASRPFDCHPEEDLVYTTSERISIDGSSTQDAFHQRAYVIEQCRITSIAESDGSTSHCRVSIPTQTQGSYITFIVSIQHSAFTDVNCTLVGVNDMEYWVIAKPIGSRTIDEEVALEVQKFAAFSIDDSAEREGLRELDPGRAGALTLWS